MLKKTLVLAALAGCAVTASAQTEGPLMADRVYYNLPADSGTYSGRAVGTVWDNGSNGDILGGLILGTTHWAEDVNFAPGPWASAATRELTEMLLAVQYSGAGCLANDPHDIVLRFYDAAAWNFTANPMTAAQPFDEVRVAIANYPCNVVATFTLNMVALNGGLPIQVPSDQIIVEVLLAEPGTTTPRPTGAAQGEFPVFVIGATQLGSSLPNYARDVNSNGIFEGGSPVIVGGGAGHENRRADATLNTVWTQMALRGELPAVTPPANTDLGPIADTGATQSTTIAADEVKWFRLVVNGDATDNALQFLDIDTEGSAVDTIVGLFSEDGTLIASDDDDGSDLLSQLTFGIGRRAAAAGTIEASRQYDGRDGELLAGTYYLGVAGFGTNFTDGFTATGASTEAGAVALNIKTNTNGTALAPSVAPAVPVEANLGQILFPGVPGFEQDIAANDVVWYQFEVCSDIDSSNFLDLDMSISNAAADTEIFLFDSNGNLVATNDDADADGVAPFYLRSQLSFGSTNPRPAIDPLAQNFAGQDGNLPAGTYYLGVGLFDTEATFDAANNGRWHLRSGSGSSFNVTVDFYTDVTQCGSACPVCAADYDQSGGIDGDDIGAFFADWQTGAPCADVDGSGGVDGDDIPFFFDRWQAGGC